jgi:hypothetical protein
LYVRLAGGTDIIMGGASSSSVTLMEIAG